MTETPVPDQPPFGRIGELHVRSIREQSYAPSSAIQPPGHQSYTPTLHAVVAFSTQLRRELKPGLRERAAYSTVE